MIKAGATQTETSFLKQYVAGERVDLLDEPNLFVAPPDKATYRKPWQQKSGVDMFSNIASLSWL